MDLLAFDDSVIFASGYVLNYSSSIVEDKAVWGVVGKRFDKKMTGNFDVDSKRKRIFIKKGFTDLTKNLFFGKPCIRTI